MDFPVGRRCLVEECCRVIPDTVEAKLLEVAPSGKRLKWLWQSGISTWEEIENYKIVEVLNNHHVKE